jgi:ATP-dependent DNA ligase I
MLLSTLVETSDAVAATRSRKAKTEALAGLITALAPDEREIGVAYLSGEPRQARLGVGYRTAFDIDVPPQAAGTLTLVEVDDALAAIERISGPGSRQRRSEALDALFGRATEREQGFLRALMLRELRQGALEGLVVVAIAAAAGVPAASVRRAVMLGGGHRAVAAAALEGGTAGLDAFRLTLFEPVQPMLAQSAESVAAAIGALGEGRVEQKLDGVRVQVHRSGEDVRVYTRNLRDVTDGLPEFAALARSLEVDSVILDGEALAFDASARPLPFQDSIGRFSQEAGGSLSVVFFDILYLDGTDLIDLPDRERRARLDAALPGHVVIRSVTTAAAATGEAFFDETIRAGHEGVMVKALDAPYEAGRRGAAWLKVKPVHTLDLVVLAVEWGSGRRRGTLSNIHLGARDPDGGGFVMLGKTFKGMTDEMLAWQTERFLALETHRTGHVVHVRPEQVVEIAFDGVQRSTRYPGGVALRFARVKRYRDDKNASETDTIDTVRGFAR